MLHKLRNIGISAHVDSGKTTLTERILFYSGVIHKIVDIRSKDGNNAKMDFDPIEVMRGITINSACTQCPWKGHAVNIIDTPGHIDFTIEVERSLRVLDGAVFVLCGVSGVQAQSYTVDRQMKRYGVPGITFINKLDTPGADPERVCRELRSKLDRNAVLFQLPLGLESEFRGIIDLVEMKAYEFSNSDLIEVNIPAEQMEKSLAQRTELLEEAALFNEEILNTLLQNEEPSVDLLKSTFREAVISGKLTPVFMGSAFKNIGVQPLLDAVCDYLPSPEDVLCKAYKDEEEVQIKADPEASVLAYAFKLQEDSFGQLTFIRLYSGRIRKGDTLFNGEGKKQRISRLVRMNADEMNEIELAEAGDIAAVFGLDCPSGTVLWSGTELRLDGMFVPNPVVEYRIELLERDKAAQLAKALGKFQKEDPTFKVKYNEESGDTVIAGMGELHLDIYVQKLEDDFGVRLNKGQPQVAYRETITGSCEFDFTLSKQTGGPGMFACVRGILEPSQEHFEFINEVKGGAIPAEYISSVEAGFKDGLGEGPLEGYPLTGVKVTLKDGAKHEQDSSDRAFRIAAQLALKDSIGNALPCVLEPLMSVSVETPSEFQGSVIGDLNRRRGCVTGTSVDGSFTVISAEVPLANMFAYVGHLRSMTQGKATFAMEFERYQIKT